MCWFFWVATIFCNNFMLPKRRFSKTENISDRRFEHFSRMRVLDLGYGYLKKCSKRRSEMFSVFENLRLGSINFARYWLQKIVATSHVMRCAVSLGCYDLL
jgi:hypothetical protein